MHALIDGDIIVFRCGFAAERKNWHLSIPSQEYVGVFEYKKEAEKVLDEKLPGVYSRQEGEDYLLWPEVDLQPLSYALQNVKTLINKSLESIQCNEFDAKLYLSGPSKENFRYEVAKTLPYKGNRDRLHRPQHEKAIIDYMLANYDCYVADGEEADDLLGIAQYSVYGPEDSVIVSIDKDLDMIPGFKYNFMHDVGYYVEPDKADENFHMQLLTGDSTDNIPGLPGIGPAKAKKALHGIPLSEQMEEVCRMYQIHSGKDDWFSYLREQGQLLWIRREVGQMWEPDPSLNTDDEQEELSLYD